MFYVQLTWKPKYQCFHPDGNMYEPHPCFCCSFITNKEDRLTLKQNKNLTTCLSFCTVSLTAAHAAEELLHKSALLTGASRTTSEGKVHKLVRFISVVCAFVPKNQIPGSAFHCWISTLFRLMVWRHLPCVKNKTSANRLCKTNRWLDN